jgi:predicted RNA-binding Zn ribbon-like protein
MKQSAPRWVWYGGRPSLDLVNTRRGRQADGSGGVEYLASPADLADWLIAGGHGDVAAAGPGLARGLDQARELREAIDAGVRAAVAGAPFPAPALEILNRWLAAAPSLGAQLQLRDGVAVLGQSAIRPTLDQVLGGIAADAAELLGTSQRSRLRICPGPGCGGRFADDSPAGRRRWCSMAVCGNRSKAATHRQVVRA